MCVSIHLYTYKYFVYIYTVKEIVSDAALFAPLIEPICSTINHMQSKIYA